MDLNYSEILTDLTCIINSNVANEDEFYETSLSKISSLFPCNFIGLFFINGDDFQQKCFLSAKKNCTYSKEVGDKIFVEALKAKENTLVFKRAKTVYLTIKLTVKNSVFGFLVINFSKEPSRTEIIVMETYSAIYSYLIKDFELGTVFKMQLNALQNAIQEKKSALDTIEKQHEKLLEADRAKNSFIANMSHDLRTPLNSIIGFSDALNSGLFGALNEKQSEYIKDIQTSSLHLLNMINEILDFSKIESRALKLNPSEFSPSVMIKEVITILSPLSQKKDIEVKFEENCKSDIFADLQKIQQVLYNLITNAIKYTKRGGLVTIRTHENGKKFILEVEDNGIGIDKKDQNKIFAKFVHLNKNTSLGEKSTGLGLAITKEFVKMHGGKIILTSKINKGSIFRVEFDAIIK